MDEADVGAAQAGARERRVEIAQEPVDVGGRHVGAVQAAGVGLVAGAGDGHAAPRRREEQPAARHAADRGCRDPSDRVTTFSPATAVGTRRGSWRAQELRRDAIALRAGGVDDEPGRDVERPVGPGGHAWLRRHVDDAEAADPAVLDERGVGPQLGGDRRTARRSRLGEGERDALAVQHLAVLPRDAAGDAGRVRERIAAPGRRRDRGSARDRGAAPDRRPRCDRAPAGRRRGSRPRRPAGCGSACPAPATRRSADRTRCGAMRSIARRSRTYSRSSSRRSACRLRTPPCSVLALLNEVPPPMSPRSIRATRRPRSVASQAIAAP